jgi:hyperosmotically inducible periplasmic protein
MRATGKFTIAFSVALLATSVTSLAADNSARDERVTEQVKNALGSDDTIDARSIEVQTRDGVVQLSGFVNSEEERSAALLRARAAPGVQEVRNDLSIREDDRPAGRPLADTVIAARVRNSLSEAELGKDSDVSVEVSEGVVQFSGFVTRPEQKARAGDLASAVEGVRDVENQIALTDEPKPSPE